MQQLGLNTSKQPTEDSRLRSFVWPSLRHLPDVEGALDVGRLACFAAAILSLVATVLMKKPAGLIDVVLYTGLGWGIGRKSRACATIALTLFTIAFVLGLVSLATGCAGGTIALALELLLLNSVRAAFAYHRLVKAAAVEAAFSADRIDNPEFDPHG